MGCDQLARAPRHLPRLPSRGRPLSRTLLLLASAAARLAAADDDAPPLAQSAAAVAPADAAFLSATLRGRTQYDRLVNSNAFAAIRALPAVQRGLDSLEEQRLMPGSPLSMAETFLQLPENEQAVEVLVDMVASDTFVYGEPSCITFLRLVQRLQQAQATAPLQAELADEDDDDDVDEEAEEDGATTAASQQAAIIQALAANLDLMVVPDVVWGFRTTKPDAVRSQLKRIEVLLKLVTQATPEFADAVARKQVDGGEVVTLTIRGDQLPWNKLDEAFGDTLDDAQESLDDVLERLRGLDLVVALGLIGDRVILSIGDSTDHLGKLALPGSGRKGLLDTKPFAPVVAHKDKPITGISYVSGALVQVNYESTTSSLAVFEELADRAGDAGELPAETVAEARRLVEATGTTFTKRMPEPGPWVAVSFLTDAGYEGYAWDWGRNHPLDGSRRLDLLEHVGGAPLAATVSRLRGDPTLVDDLATLAAGGWDLFRKVGMSRMDDDDREKAEAFDEHVVPLGAKFVEVLRTKMMPALADGQVGLVLDAKTKTTRPQASLPASAEPLPLLEPAIVLHLGDPKKFREGLSDLFQLTDDLVDAVRAIDPDAVPAGYAVPDPEKTKVDAGSIWTFALPASGLDEQLRPAIGVGGDAAVFSLVPAQAGRLLADSKLETGSQLAAFDEPLAGAATLDFAGLVDAVRPWIVYVTRYGCVQQRDGQVEADEELSAEDETAVAREALEHVAVVLDAAKCFRAAVAETSVTDDATVTHWKNVIRDMPARR